MLSYVEVGRAIELVRGAKFDISYEHVRSTVNLLVL